MSKKQKWLSLDERGIAAIDLDIAGPVVLDRIGIAEADLDQYWIETVYQWVKLAAQEHVAARGLPAGRAPEFRVVDRGARWRLAGRKPGKGVAAATKGLEAKAGYPRVRLALLAALD